MPNSINQIVEKADTLISFPEVVSQFNDAVNNGRSDVDELGMIIQQDPALTAKLLQVANSAFFGAMAPAENVQEAIIRIGTRQIRDLVFSVCAKNAFDEIPVNLITPADFWRHSLLCGLSARTLAKSTRVFPAESMFTAGLLHDIGSLILFSLEPEKSVQALELNLDKYDGMDSSSSEKEVFGFDHAQVGFELAVQWNLPELIQTCIGYHHQPSAENPHAKQVAVLHIANTIASLIEVESHDLSQGPEIDEAVWEALATDSSVIEGCFATVSEEYADMARLLFGDVSVAA